jgi:nicotinate-nucleotide adenylyltransferase
MKIGILGGSFNPIHNGHLAMAEAALRAHGLDRVIFVPAGRPPHKRSDLAPAADRLEMVRLATRGREGVEASGIEIERPGTSYTVDTLEAFRALYPGAELYFIIGEDSVPELPGWREPARILALARIVAVNRPGPPATFKPEAFPGVPRDVIDRLEKDRVRMTPSPIESTRIREAVERGEPISAWVPGAVEAYIRRQGLYRGGG